MSKYELIPRRDGTWPQAMVMADPVMKPAMAVKGINSIRKSSRRRPMPRVMMPQKKARVVAIWGAVNSLPVDARTDAMTFAVCRDITATGPMVTSLDVAKKQ